MPKLLVFAPCEKVIISQDENNPTLIAILSSLKLSIPPDELRKLTESDPKEVPAVPLRWSVFTLWQREDGDDGISFRQTIDFVAPDGRVLFNSAGSVAFSEKARTHRTVVSVLNFPLTAAGDYSIRLSLNDKLVSEYPLELKIETPSPTT